MKKKLLTLVCLAAMMAAGTSLKAQEVTIVLMPGWTWISIPSTDTLDFATALGSFTPSIGDMIKSRWGSSTYVNGRWVGSISQFYPGYGYHYKSVRTVPVMLTFNVQQPTPQVVVTTSEPTDITQNSATCGGNVASSNGDYVSVTLRGICWSTNPNPTFNDNYIEAGNGLGSFTVSMTELTPGITYYVRACAVTADGTYYGEQKTFVISQAGIWIDLGLPSGLLWATCNVGADAPEEYGDYFAWGETQPKDTYNWSTYQYCNGTYITLTKYCNNSSYSYNGFTDNLTTLLPEDDAATANWGSDWRMPTQAEFQELLDNTTVTLTTQNGVNGHLFTASNGNSLFLPAAGYYYNSDFNSAGSNGFYWSSSLCTDYPDAAWNFSSGFNMSGYSRYYGFTVRPVRSSGQNASFVIDATANPAEGGVVTGGGTYQEGAECTLTATANEGYTFTNWTENGEVVSTEVAYSFTVISDRTLVANFAYNSGSDHEYVDLGLPSGLLWATCNVGADNPEDNGDYFAWGETQPKDFYDWSTHPHCNGSNNTLTKYCSNSSYGYNGFTDNLTTLLPEDDAAMANWGGGWRMPTQAEFQELLDNTTVTWATQNGVNGRLFTASNGNSLFLPAAGYRYDSSLNEEGSCGNYWSSSLDTGFPDRAWSFGFRSDVYSVNLDGHRNWGRSVRPVLSGQSNAPTGAINGKFTINEEGDQVYFSQGNLQYQASTNTWKFAENQYDYVGSDNSNISSAYSGWIDLFGWGTSGYNHGAVCYQPWSTSEIFSDYYAYGNWEYDLYEETGQADWGYNAIINGNNTENIWRTLTRNEWYYLFNTRNTVSGIRWTQGKVNGINGIILLPDNWTVSIYALNATNGGDFDSNIISEADWNNILEANGAVFLPAAGYRLGNSVQLNVGLNYYWSASHYLSNSSYASNNAYGVYFFNGYLDVRMLGRREGRSVRLVSNAE